MGKGGSPARIHVITVMCFDSSECLNIKLYWIWNENSWGTRLDQHFSPSALHHTYSHTAAFMQPKWHSFVTHPPTHSLWITLMRCDNTFANAPLRIGPQKKQQCATITQQTAHKRIRTGAAAWVLYGSYKFISAAVMWGWAGRQVVRLVDRQVTDTIIKHTHAQNIIY